MKHPGDRLQDLIAAVNRGERPKYIFFWGHTPPRTGVDGSCCSQWFEAGFEIDGQHYPTAEHWMMSGKARLFGDESALRGILASTHPNEAKQIGRQVRGFDDAIWADKRYPLVVQGNIAKFQQNPELLEWLLATGERVLVEASPYDKIWGIGMARDDRNVEDPKRWKGANLLGFAIMEAREQLAGG